MRISWNGDRGGGMEGGKKERREKEMISVNGRYSVSQSPVTGQFSMYHRDARWSWNLVYEKLVLGSRFITRLARVQIGRLRDAISLLMEQSSGENDATARRQSDLNYTYQETFANARGKERFTPTKRISKYHGK